ncbi:YhjD/YihY/BrkB family envelope integrity protein [Pseudokineococcus basanitobsidens]|uniref:YhjD/YihY/BrkB family envelope integrity protein n=1 Tax=Pseudokineococcus basanitobsidens TaxID=1926649 RepID=A0ABU8RJM1_9ACTN
MPPAHDAAVHDGGVPVAQRGPTRQDAGAGRRRDHDEARRAPALRRRAVLRRLPARTRGLLRRHELPLTAAGLTFYGALAAVPSVLIAVRVAGWLVGDDRMLALGGSLEAALPSTMGVDAVARAAVVYGLGVTWPVVVFSLFPASLYGEGLRRAYAALGDGRRETAAGALGPDDGGPDDGGPGDGGPGGGADDGGPDDGGPGGGADDGGRPTDRTGAGGSRVRRLLARFGSGWRARGALLPVLAAAPVLLLVVLGITPLVADLFARGLDGSALAVYLSLNVDWVVISLPLAWSFRAVAPQDLSWRAALVGGFATGAFVAGFVQGIVLFVALPVDVGAPFGGSAAVGGVVAGLLWLWLLHVVVLVGFAATLSAVALRRGR